MAIKSKTLLANRKNYGIERDSGHFRPTRFVQIRRTIVARRHRRVVVGRQTHECRKQLQSERTDRNIHLHRGRGHPARRGFHQNLRTYAGTASHHKEAPEKLKAYFAEVLPEYDRDRVHVSDMKKVFSWFNTLVGAGFTEFKLPAEQEA